MRKIQRPQKLLPKGVVQRGCSTVTMPSDESAEFQRLNVNAHDLLPNALRAQLPQLYSTDGQGHEAMAHIKLFTPDAQWTWYVTEFDQVGGDTCFGLVIGHEKELGYFSLDELKTLRGPHGLAVERDLYFKPTKLKDLPDGHALTHLPPTATQTQTLTSTQGDFPMTQTMPIETPTFETSTVLLGKELVGDEATVFLQSVAAIVPDLSGIGTGALKAAVLKDNLARALNLVSRVALKKSPLPILQCVHLSGAGERLTLSATDLKTSVRLSLGAKVECAGSVDVPAELLTAYVSQLPSERIDLAVSAQGKLTLKAGRNQTTINSSNTDDFPPLPLPNAEQRAQAVTMEAKLLSELLTQVVFAAAKDDSHPVLTGVFVELTPEQLTLSAADGFRSSRTGRTLQATTNATTQRAHDDATREGIHSAFQATTRIVLKPYERR